MRVGASAEPFPNPEDAAECGAVFSHSQEDRDMAPGSSWPYLPMGKPCQDIFKVPVLCVSWMTWASTWACRAGRMLTAKPQP